MMFRFDTDQDSCQRRFQARFGVLGIFEHSLAGLVGAVVRYPRWWDEVHGAREARIERVGSSRLRGRWVQRTWLACKDPRGRRGGDK